MKILERNIINAFGEIGRKWINSLPAMVEKLSKIWDLDNIRLVNNMSWNFVALATKNNTPVVLKISCDDNLIRDEYKTLKHFDGNGAIKVLGINTEYNAILLEQAIPGFLLKERYSSKMEDTISIYCQVIKNLAAHALPDRSFTHVKEWCKVIDKITDQRIDKRFVDKAKKLKSALLYSIEHEYLCHGDLHLENIIENKSTWLAIDPKGIIGEMAFEAAAFDLINKDELSDSSTILAKIIQRLTKLSEGLELNFDRLLSWVFLRIIISAQWFIEDNGDPSQMLILANHIYLILEKHSEKIHLKL